ncbi:hypothetical protein YC2023_030751 [Brassica napus]
MLCTVLQHFLNRFLAQVAHLLHNSLEKLMMLSIKVQRAILRQGSPAITKTGCIRSGRKFRWMKVENSIDAKYLGYPQALTKFCYFLMDTLREK